jgi:hypothetical protein
VLASILTLIGFFPWYPFHVSGYNCILSSTPFMSLATIVSLAGHLVTTTYMIQQNMAIKQNKQTQDDQVHTHCTLFYRFVSSLT